MLSSALGCSHKSTATPARSPAIMGNNQDVICLVRTFISAEPECEIVHSVAKGAGLWVRLLAQKLLLNDRKVNMQKRDVLVAAMNRYLQVEQYKDYSPNGLQVEGREQVKR